MVEAQQGDSLPEWAIDKPQTPCYYGPHAGSDLP